jgi:hydroxymethylpyrimidine/phosphomethylpyrimidine kinase
VHPIPPDIVAAQIKVCLKDIGADVIKIGMLGSSAVIEAVADALSHHRHIPVVLDPVMIAKGGHALLDDGAIGSLKTKLLPHSIITPNAPEAAALTEEDVETPFDLQRAGERLVEMGARAAVVKGGHLEGNTVTDVLVTAKGTEHYESPRIVTQHTHGTGCTLSTAIACAVAEGVELNIAVSRARLYLHQAIKNAPGFGHGHGPVNHLPS